MIKKASDKKLLWITNDTSIYESYVNAIDYPWKIDKIITPIVKNKTILNLEVWNLKYMKLLSQITKKTIWIDVSWKDKKRNNLKNTSIKNLKDIEDWSIDIAIWYWFFSKFEDIDLRSQYIVQVIKKLKKWWEIYLIENDNTSEFEEITWKYQIQPNPTLIYNTWLMNEIWFNIFYKIETFFKFDDTDQAKTTFSAIWWEQVWEKIRNRTIQQRIIIFKYKKP